MSVIDQLIKLAESAEAEARTYRSTAALLGGRLRAAAAKALPAKLKQAARLRAEAAPVVEATPIKHAKGGLLRLVAQVLAESRTRLDADALNERIRAQGFEGRGIGALYRANLITERRGGWIALTAKGRARAAEYADGTFERARWKRDRRRGKSRRAKAPKATPRTNGKGHGSETEYVAAVVKANGGPISGTDILAKAKAEGRKVRPQAIGAARRYRLIDAAPRENGERMFQAPA